MADRRLLVLFASLNTRPINHMNPPSLEQYFSDRLLAPLREWQREAATNKEFYLGEKTFEYVVTLVGHEPVVDYPTDL